MSINISKTGNTLINVELDLTGMERIKEKMELLKTVIPETLKAAGDYSQGVWIKNAQQSMRSPQNYVNAVIKGTSFNNERYAIIPDYVKKSKTGEIDIIKLMEYGYQAFDMKDKLLKGRNKKVIKFEYGIPGSGIHPELPNKIYNMAMEKLALNREVKDDKGYDINPKKLKYFTILAPTQSSFPRHGIQENPITMEYKWKTRQFKGLKISGNKGSIYRTVSKKSPSDSWINPGQPAKNILKNTADNIIPTVKDMFEKAVNKLASQ